MENEKKISEYIFFPEGWGNALGKTVHVEYDENYVYLDGLDYVNLSGDINPEETKNYLAVPARSGENKKLFDGILREIVDMNRRSMEDNHMIEFDGRKVFLVLSNETDYRRIPLSSVRKIYLKK